MAYIISFLNQKGGVGKSTLARLAAVEFARMDGGTWEVKIADLDISQGTSFKWQQRRAAAGHTPEIRVEGMRPDRAIKDAANVHVMVMDGAPHATADTRTAALASDLCVLPSGVSLDDMIPTVELSYELRRAGVDMSKVIVVLTRTGRSDAEEREAREYFGKAGLTVSAVTLSEQIMYRRASDLGCSVSETKNRSLNDKAQLVFASMIAPMMGEPSNEQTENVA